MAKKSKLGVASAIVVGAGAAALYAKKASENKQAKNGQTGKKADETQERNEYRNTERGKYEKTAKVFITAAATTKHLPVRKNRKVLTISMHTL